MVELNDFMQYKNVLSKSYRIPKDKQELAIRDFLEAVIAMGGEMATSPFFAIEGSKDEEIIVKYYVSIENNNPGTLIRGLHFDTYFGVEPMAAAVLAGDIAVQSEKAYEMLYETLEKNGLVATSPVFVHPSGDNDFQYATLKVGYADKRFFE
jgi:ubiquinone/menaquinone biosynthesis C-methylase UbiE